MPSSLPTRDEAATRLASTIKDDDGFRNAASAAAVTAACNVYWVALAEEAGRPEAPEGETQTGDWAELRSLVADCRRSAAACHGERNLGRVNAYDVVLGGIDRLAPRPVPVSTERTDGETGGLGPGHDDEWGAEGGHRVIQVLLKAPNGIGPILSVEGGGRESVVLTDADRARLVRALGGTTVPASLPPLTDEDVERAMRAAIGADEPFRAALLSTGLYATPRGKG